MFFSASHAAGMAQSPPASCALLIERDIEFRFLTIASMREPRLMLIRLSREPHTAAFRADLHRLDLIFALRLAPQSRWHLRLRRLRGDDRG